MIIEKTIGSSVYMDASTPRSAIKDVDQLMEKYDNFNLIGYLQAGEVGQCRLYTCDYGSFYFFTEESFTKPNQVEMRDCTYTQAIEVLIDWFDKENSAWDACQAGYATPVTTGRHFKVEEPV